MTQARAEQQAKSYELTEPWQLHQQCESPEKKGNIVVLGKFASTPRTG